MLLKILTFFINTTPQERMYNRLYAPAVKMLLLSIVFLWGGDIAYEHLANIKLHGVALFINLAELLRIGSMWASTALIAIGVLYFTNSTYKIWKWQKCESDFCHVCGGMVVFKSGHRGDYYKCLACGRNRSIR